MLISCVSTQTPVLFRSDCLIISMMCSRLVEWMRALETLAIHDMIDARYFWVWIAMLYHPYFTKHLVLFRQIFLHFFLTIKTLSGCDVLLIGMLNIKSLFVLFHLLRLFLLYYFRNCYQLSSN
jgi:hypothetical protein